VVRVVPFGRRRVRGADTSGPVPFGASRTLYKFGGGRRPCRTGAYLGMRSSGLVFVIPYLPARAGSRAVSVGTLMGAPWVTMNAGIRSMSVAVLGQDRICSLRQRRRRWSAPFCRRSAPRAIFSLFTSRASCSSPGPRHLARAAGSVRRSARSNPSRPEPDRPGLSCGASTAPVPSLKLTRSFTGSRWCVGASPVGAAGTKGLLDGRRGEVQSRDQLRCQAGK